MLDIKKQISLNKKKNRFVYRRFMGKAEYIIDCNIGKDTSKSYTVGDGYDLVYSTGGKGKIMKSYEARIWKKNV